MSIWLLASGARHQPFCCILPLHVATMIALPICNESTSCNSQWFTTGFVNAMDNSLVLGKPHECKVTLSSLVLPRWPHNISHCHISHCTSCPLQHHLHLTVVSRDFCPLFPSACANRHPKFLARNKKSIAHCTMQPWQPVKIWRKCAHCSLTTWAVIKWVRYHLKAHTPLIAMVSFL